jgi:hypothetical protein
MVRGHAAGNFIAMMAQELARIDAILLADFSRNGTPPLPLAIGESSGGNSGEQQGVASFRANGD